MTRTLPRRQGTPDTTYDFNAQDGTLVTVRSDADGVVVIHDQHEAALADAFGLGHLEPERSKGRKSTTDESTGDEPAQEG